MAGVFELLKCMNDGGGKIVNHGEWMMVRWLNFIKNASSMMAATVFIVILCFGGVEIMLLDFFEYRETK